MWISVKLFCGKISAKPLFYSTYDVLKDRQEESVSIKIFSICLDLCYPILPFMIHCTFLENKKTQLQPVLLKQKPECAESGLISFC